MEEIKHDPDCPHCARREEEIKRSEEISMAFLVALVPLMTLTLFSNIGLV